MNRQSIRGQRARLGLTQARTAKRMNQLGFTWYAQTVGLVERNQRPLLADELVALALALETTPDVLYGPPPDVSLVLFGEERIPAQRLVIVDDSVRWDDDTLKVSAPTVQYRPVEQRAVVHEMREELRRRAGGESLPQGEEPDVWTEDIAPKRPGSGRKSDPR